MIDFALPALLGLLLLIPGLVYLRYRPRRGPALLFSDGQALARLRPGIWLRLRFLLPLLYALGLVFLVVALAGPRKGLEESIVRTEAVDIILLVDVSSSMRAEDFNTPLKRMNRLDSAQEVISEFIESRPHDRIGMVAFAALPYSVSPLTLDHAWLQRQVERLSTDMLEDGTAIGSALASAVNRLRDSEAKSKVVVLLTDGENNAGTIAPVDAAQAANALDVKVYTVGAGRDGEVPMPVTDRYGKTRYRRQWSRIDERTLKQIAQITDARYFRATNLKALGEVYEEIDELEKTEIEVQNFTRYEPLFAPLLAAGLVLLGLEKLLALTRMGRLPS